MCVCELTMQWKKACLYPSWKELLWTHWFKIYLDKTPNNFLILLVDYNFINHPSKLKYISYYYRFDVVSKTISITTIFNIFLKLFYRQPHMRVKEMRAHFSGLIITIVFPFSAFITKISIPDLSVFKENINPFLFLIDSGHEPIKDEILLPLLKIQSLKGFYKALKYFHIINFFLHGFIQIYI